MSSSHNSISNRDGQMKFATNRVTNVEKYYGLFCDTLGSVIRKSARSRDKGDLFAHHLKEFSELENFNNSTKICLHKFAENFSTIQDYREAEIQRLEAKVLKPLMRYGELCKNMKSSIKGNSSAVDKQKKQEAKLDKMQHKMPTSSPAVTKAQTDLHRLRQETGVYGEQLISEVDTFEKGKLADLKTALTEFVQIEMMFHARALKYLSKCYDNVQRIDTDADMEQFRSALLEASGLAGAMTQTGSSSGGYSTTLASGTLSSTHGSNLTPGYPQPTPRPRRMYDDADDEDDDSDSYEDYDS